MSNVRVKVFMTSYMLNSHIIVCMYLNGKHARYDVKMSIHFYVRVSNEASGRVTVPQHYYTLTFHIYTELQLYHGR